MKTLPSARSLSMLGLWAGLCLTEFAADAPAQEARNTIFLMGDDLRADALGCYGSEFAHTPNLDKLATTGIRFTNAFVTTSICVSSRATVMTGQYSSTHGVWQFNEDFRPEVLTDQTYFGAMKKAGTHIGFLGKWGVGKPPHEFLGFSRSFGGQGQYFPENRFDGTRHLTSIMGDDAIDFITSSKPGQPFHLSVSFKAPHCQDSTDIYAEHFPYDPALEHLFTDREMPLPETAGEEYYQRLPSFTWDSMNRARWAIRFRSPQTYQKSVKGYHRLVAGIDVAVGRIVAALEEQGKLDTTTIIFTSDHGFYLGEYGLAGKWYAHELSIRIPLIISTPESRKAGQGREVDAYALNIDFAPTLLEMSGVPVPDPMQGRSLVPFCQGNGQAPADWRTDMYYEHRLDPPWSPGSIPPSEAVRTDRWKYINWIGNDLEQLFDLENDPQEVNDLLPSDDPEIRAVLQRLRDRLAELRIEAGAPALPPGPN